ncbi:ABC-2 transporter permease [Virgibacillus dokdonensis]|uniref:ABC-2 transporter permease n=1 Tax=Virgibacillus dokdonensis TaxID=302167 RepID=UPI00098A7820|nr:ABC transporter permease [Virgibacillus dokdonensis]
MIGQIIKKQFLLLWRSPVELLLLLALPVVLIVILGSALGNFMDGDSPGMHAKVAMIEHSSEREQFEKFKRDFETDLGLTEDTVANIEKRLPIQTLKTIFHTKEISKMMELEEISVEEKSKILQEDTYTAVIEVPEDFSYQYLSYILLDRKQAPQLQLYENEEKQLSAGAIQSIIKSFQQQLTLESLLEEKGMEQNEADLSTISVEGQQKNLEQRKSITAKEYYTVGMAVMNALFVASTIGLIAFREKQSFVFARIILANMSKWTYFTGVLCSAVIFSLIQLLVIYGFAWLIFDVTWGDLTAFIVITIAFSIAVGGITVLLTAISYRMHSETVTNLFSSVIVSILALVGGSFFPIGENVQVIELIGNFTPNGSGMSAYLAILRGESIGKIGNHILFLSVFGFAMIMIAAMTFPKRGKMV